MGAVYQELLLHRRDRKERIVKGGEEWRWVSHIMADVDTSSKKTVEVYTERYDVCADIAEHPDMKALVSVQNWIILRMLKLVLKSLLYMK